MNTTDLKSRWLSVTAAWDGEGEWPHIEAAYSAPGRHYHTLTHLCTVYDELHDRYATEIPQATVLTLFFHDIIYNTLRGDNEKRSAAHAEKMMLDWKADCALIAKVSDMISATASHESDDPETQLFLDADMAILGADYATYRVYITDVRKEYNIYPDLLYYPGRKKFVETTLKRDRIFLTDHFYNKYEAQARINLTHELNSRS